MTKIKLLPIILIFFAGFLSCKPTASVIGTWVNKDKVQGHAKVKRVFITVMAQNEVVKSTLENDLAEAAAKKGIKSEMSFYVFGRVLARDSLPPKEIILNQIRKMGCDAIFVVALIDQKSETRYTPSSSMYTPMPYYGYYGSFGSYYSYSSVVYSPGYYTTENTYYLDSNLYDATTEDLLVSMQSKVVNPKSIEKSSKEYTAALIQELENQGFLKDK